MSARATDNQPRKVCATAAAAPATAATAPVCDVPATGSRCVCSIYCDDGHVVNVVSCTDDSLCQWEVCTRNSSNDEVFLLCLLACVLMKQTVMENSWARKKWEVKGSKVRIVGIHNSITGQFPYSYSYSYS